MEINNTAKNDFTLVISEEKNRRFNRLRRWYDKYERYLIPGALLLGVATDALLFKSINLTLAFLILTGHLILSGTTMAFIQGYDAGRFARKVFRYVRLFSPLVLQYTFGALLSGFLIFYWFSGTFAASWPFIALIVILMVSNDIFKQYYLRLNVQIGVYFFIVFSYAVLILPFLLRRIEAWVFVLSGLLSLILIWGYLSALAKLVPTIRARRRFFAGLIGGIFILINILYFTNIIPPVPLSLREAGVYYSVTRLDGEYRIVAPDPSWWRKFLPGQVLPIRPGRPIYFYTAIFSPTRLNTDIIHHWQFYDEENNRWISQGRVSYAIVGGRDGGYRGFSFINQARPGRWRVSVETRRGQVIGRQTFRLKTVDEIPATEIIWR
ncbi:MAG: DUF2914 domain-containing protein [Candidatus Paceibacterota bacterium]